MGDFGHNLYGHDIIGRLHYGQENRQGCKPFSNETDFKVDPPFDEESDQTPIVLLEHGGCSMIEKVWNAQMFGFNAAIIIDDDAKDFVELRMHGFEKHVDEVKGSAITIPYYKIFSIDGKKLIKYIRDELPA